MEGSFSIHNIQTNTENHEQHKTRDHPWYRPELVERARELRKNLTPAETLLWKNLKGKKINGFDFDRQKPIDRFIVDFYCKILKLAIEVDGQSHDFKIEYDLKRQKRWNLLELKSYVLLKRKYYMTLITSSQKLNTGPKNSPPGRGPVHPRPADNEGWVPTTSRKKPSLAIIKQ